MNGLDPAVHHLESASALEVVRAAAQEEKHAAYVGLDVHKETIAVAMAEPARGGRSSHLGRGGAGRIGAPLRHERWSLRAWYRVWRRLPFGADNHIGTGFYGLSEARRIRFGAFPDTMAEDFYVLVGGVGRPPPGRAGP